MGLLACVFLLLLSCNWKLPIQLHFLHSITAASTRLWHDGLGRDVQGENGSCINGFVSSSAFNCSEYRPPRLKCCCCLFAIRGVRIAIPDSHRKVVVRGQIPTSVTLLPWWWWLVSTATLCPLCCLWSWVQPWCIPVTQDGLMSPHFKSA